MMVALPTWRRAGERLRADPAHSPSSGSATVAPSSSSPRIVPLLTVRRLALLRRATVAGERLLPPPWLRSNCYFISTPLGKYALTSSWVRSGVRVPGLRPGVTWKAYGGFPIEKKKPPRFSRGWHASRGSRYHLGLLLYHYSTPSRPCQASTQKNRRRSRVRPSRR